MFDKEIIRKNKQTIKDDIRIVNSWGIHRKPTRQIEILDYIRKNPNCTRSSIYSICEKTGIGESHIRESLLILLKSGKVRETFTINDTK